MAREASGWLGRHGRNGRAERTVWETLLEMDKSDRAGETNHGAITLVLDLAEASERVSRPVVYAWATHFNFSSKILRVLCGYFEHQRWVQFEGRVAEPLQTVAAILLGSDRSCLCTRL